MRKKRKSAAAIFLSFALTGMVLAGCGANQQSQQDMQQSIPVSMLQENGQNSAAENAEPCMAGFSISGGRTANINFGVSDGVLAISGINY